MLVRMGFALKTLLLCFLRCVAAVLLTVPAAAPQQPQREARVLPLVRAGGKYPLLRGAPQTAGMRSGFVRLAPGETVGRHTTGKNEETLVILRGRGDALLDGEKRISFTTPVVVYFPPFTYHTIVNTGREPLEYVYVVALAMQ